MQSCMHASVASATSISFNGRQACTSCMSACIGISGSQTLRRILTWTQSSYLDHRLVSPPGSAAAALQAERGTTLRTALLQAGVTPHNGRAALINCRGLGTCGTCAVQVKGAVEPGQWTQQERLRLHFPPHSPPGNLQLRLACQVRRHLSLACLLGGWPAR